METQGSSRWRFSEQLLKVELIREEPTFLSPKAFSSTYPPLDTSVIVFNFSIFLIQNNGRQVIDLRNIFQVGFKIQIHL